MEAIREQITPQKVEAAKSPRDEKDPWTIYNDELRLYLQFMRAAFSFNLKPAPSKPNGNDLLCSDGNFLETQITSVKAFDKDGNEVSPVNAANDNKVPQFNKPPARVVAYLAHVEMEYIPGEKEKFKAGKFKYKPDAEKLLDADKAIRERAKAAYSMIYAAKAKGWTKVRFGKTSNIIDRMLLVQACKHMGIKHDGETLGTSVHDDVKPTGFPRADSEIVKAYLKKSKIDISQATPDQQKKLILNAVQVHIDNFLETYTEPVDRDDPMPSPSPSVFQKTITPPAAANDEPEEQENPGGLRPPSDDAARAAFAM